MVLPWALLMFLTGALFGWLATGRGVRRTVAAAALVSGVFLAGTAVAAGVYTGAHPLGLSPSPVGAFASVVLLTLLYGLGVWFAGLARERAAGRVWRRDT